MAEKELYHYGILGMKWGVRRFQNPDGTLTEAGKKRYNTLFVSGSSKTTDKNSPYYRRKLPKFVRKELKKSAANDDKIIVGDAPGIDSQVQDYLKKRNYKNVEIYTSYKNPRYKADENWKTNSVDASEYKEGSKEFLAKKDKAMTDASTKGLAVVLDEGSKATKENVKRMIGQNKEVSVYQLSKPLVNPLFKGYGTSNDTRLKYGGTYVQRNGEGYDQFQRKIDRNNYEGVKLYEGSYKTDVEEKKKRKRW